MYISLYRRYRPQSFSDVVGQAAAIGVITRAVENGTMGHAYLFSGPRGCGKTTIARLFAKAVNCPHRHGAEPCNECETCRAIVEGSCLDVIEIDGASNNSVDEIRDLKEHVALASFTCPYKVYIIDEVHMLSISAFNALLKTLEEPPERVIFILATTAPHKVPVTIRSRCQHIPFHGMTPEQIVSRLEQVASAEKIEVQNEALWEIARNSEGGMRDALSLMEQAIAYGTGAIRRDTIDKLLGGGSASSIRQWLTLCREKPSDSLPQLESLFRSGAVPERFLGTLFTCVRNLWLQARWGEKVLSSLMLSEEEKEWLKAERTSFSQSQLERLMSQIASLLPQARRGISNDVLSGLLVTWLQSGEAVPVQTNFVPSQASAAEHKVVPVFEKTLNPQEQKQSSSPAPHLPLPGIEQVETHNPLPVSTASDTSAAITPPQTDGLSATDDSLQQFLLKELAAAPQTVMPLLLTDIICDEPNGAFSLCLAEQDTLAFENLKDERSLKSVASLFKKAGLEVRSLNLFCGEQSAHLHDILESEISNLETSSAPSKQSSQPLAAEQPKQQKDFFIHPVDETPLKHDKQNSHSDAPQTGHESLSDFLRSFMDGSLLYCRLNEDADDTGDEEEN